MDFATLIALFEKYCVSFVSVTQSFNTTPAHGPTDAEHPAVLRAVRARALGERIRDKIAAIARRGMWMGGVVPLGYQVLDRKLVIDEQEAALVRMIFERFLELGSAALLAKSIAAEGIRGRRGKLLNKGSLYKLLANRTYIGEVTHKGAVYPGQHQPIIGRKALGQGPLHPAGKPAGQSRSNPRRTPALLKGLLYGPTGRAMSPTHTRRGNRLYRYYVSQAVLKHGPEACPVRRVPAAEIEAAVVDQLRVHAAVAGDHCRHVARRAVGDQRAVRKRRPRGARATGSGLG